MDDKSIVQLYWDRSEQAIVETDTKYGAAVQNRIAKEKYGLPTHLLHAYKLAISGCDEGSPLAYLNGKEFICPLPENFESIKNKIFG